MIAVKVGMADMVEGEVKEIPESCPEMLRKTREELAKQKMLNLLLILLIICYILYKLVKDKKNW